MRIVNLNCFCGRIPGVVDFLKNQDADIYTLQEVTAAADEMPNEPVYFKHKEKSSPHPTNPRLLFDLMDAFESDYHFEYDIMVTTTNKTESGREYKIHWGILTLVRRSIFSRGRSLVKLLAGEYVDNFLPSAPTPGIAHAQRIVSPTTHSDIVICNVHGMWIAGAGKGDCELRRRQANSLSNIMTRVVEPGDAVIMCGDFNLRPNSRTFSLLERKCGLRNISVEQELTDTRTSFYTGEVREADYMLLNSTASIDITDNSLKVIREPEVSDHCPLVLDLDLF